VQCIGEAFGVNPADEAQRARLTVSPANLESIFDVYLKTRDKVNSGAATSPTSAHAGHPAHAIHSTRPTHGPTAEDKANAEKYKLQGNNLMTQKSFTAAVDAYTSAIKLDPGNPVYYSNRAAAYSSLDDQDKAIDDANKALAIDPAFVKAYSRLG
jgi:small glutamine-rich tetratricopeptide repeat-containing protein alpha